MTDIRYDGPDLEADTSGRVQGLAMTAIMAGEGINAGRREAASRREQADDRIAATQRAADQRLWSATPAGELGELTDDQLAARWVATARHPDDPAACRARAGLEAELDRRDPETMRDYRSWRNAGATEPGYAMRLALTEREVRLEQAWKPLVTGPATDLDAATLPTAWMAALGSLSPDAEPAVAAGEAELRTRLPDQMAHYDQAVATGMPRHEAARTHVAGRTPTSAAFGPGGTWHDVARYGVTARTPAPRTASPPGSGPAPAPALAPAPGLVAAAQRGPRRP